MCTRTTTESNEEKKDATEEPAEAAPDETDLDNDDLKDAPQSDGESAASDEGEIGSLKTYTLKWKNVSYDEFGIMYTFENKNGEEVVFTQLADPDFKESDYYTSTAVKDQIFPILEIREDVKEKWFEVVTEIQEMENVNEPNEPYRAPVIISIKSI